MRFLLVLLVILSSAAQSRAQRDHLIGSPDTPPSRIDPAGKLHEDWGVVQLRINHSGEEMPVVQHYEVSPVPVLFTRTGKGNFLFTSSTYRAPIWPSGVDVLTAAFRNQSDQRVQVQVELLIPDEVEVGERAGSLQGRKVLVLPGNPKPVRIERNWGCTGGVVSMPGWARPRGDCDPAFRNISAGMGGVPVLYRFKVAEGAEKTVVLGLCESHWADAGRRPLLLYVEGAPRTEIDPIARWGRHEAGCLRFDARDSNQDGFLQVAVAPHPEASDKNTILNVIWVFSLDTYVDTAEVLLGRMSSVAEYYVDVGGEKDQLLYERGKVLYNLDLNPGAEEEFTFLFACTGGSVPDPARTSWTHQSLWKAAEDVWGDWFSRGARMQLSKSMMDGWKKALAQILMTRDQADAFYVALPGPGGLNKFSFRVAAILTAALDFASHPDEAERLLRVYWDQPAPKPFSHLAQGKDGRWQDPVQDPCAHGFALQALARHALISSDQRWAAMAWPAIDAGIEWLRRKGRESLHSEEAKKVSAAGLLGAAQVSRLLEEGDAEQIEKDAKELSSHAEWEWMDLVEESEPVVTDAAGLINLRNGLVKEENQELLLLSGFSLKWLREGKLSVEALPTEFGRLSLRVECTEKVLQISVELSSIRPAAALVIFSPILSGKSPIAVQVDGEPVPLRPEGRIRIAPSAGPHHITIQYP